MKPRIAVVGVHGHGTWHVRHCTDLHTSGRIHFTAVADPQLASPAKGGEAGRVTRVEDLPEGTQVFADLASLLAETEVDVVVISTPIHTHVQLAEMALRAGADVLLEKPPAPSVQEFDQLTTVLAETGRSCQVGFQAHGSGAARALAAMVADGTLGELRGIAMTGHWVRARAYWERAPWAGRRTLDGVTVVDGAVTNPFAHAVATALLVDGSGRTGDIVSVETDLYRANPIEADDTSTVRIRTTRGTTLLAAFTLCAAQNEDPRIVVNGSAGQAVLRYTIDDLSGTRYGREGLLENLLDHRRDPAVALLAPLAATGAFTRVLDAVRQAPAPREIAAEYVQWRGTAPAERHPVVPGIEKWIDRAARDYALFSELGVPWASPA